jgi:exodeoxyribonuclease V gamma subunit
VRVLYVHRSERADRLVEGLAELLREPPADQLAVEIVAVPARGVERWVTQRLSHVLGAAGGEDGVCANVRFPSPAGLVAEAVAATDDSPGEEGNPWERGRLLWTLLEVIDHHDHEPWAGALGGRRLTAAQHLAALFDSYGAHRPAMLRSWANGDDTDGAGVRLSDDLAWQAQLWRRLRERIGTPSPAERLPLACAALRERPEIVELPDRLSLFGPTRLTTGQLKVVAALAHAREVHLWLPHPSAALWDAVAPYAAESRRTRRGDDQTADVVRNPLLASLGRDARELQLQLGVCDVAISDEHLPLRTWPATLLGRLQQSLQDDAPPERQRQALDESDRSLQVHACHGPARQVEVLRDVVTGLLADDPTLEPRDVLVMCPDIEDYAPLISATFGLEDDDSAQEQHPGHRLRVRLADRSLRQTNPLLGTLATLLDLADARVAASQVLDLAGSPPVRRRFRFIDDDLERLQEWVVESGVRWGLDAPHRGRFGLSAVAQNTWRAGLDRILLGAAMAEDDLRWIDTALPLDDVDSTDIDLAGRLAELLDRLAHTLDRLAGERPLADWLATLTEALDALTAVRDADDWQSAQARRELGAVATEAADRAGTIELSLGDVRALLADRLAGRPTRANFRTGTLTMCSMVPMRSVPHRVVCLLGLDDGRFPRSSGRDGDDVLARDPLVGERDPRSEDRQLLLDAVLAAREHLVILYTGADPRTNAWRPPAVPVGEILDAVDALATAYDGRPARESVVVRHPLQPFDARNFTAGALGTDRPFSFDVQALRGARRGLQPREPAEPFLPTPLPPAEDADVALDELVAFLEHPVRAFLRQRLGVALLRDEDEVLDDLAVDLDGLQSWGVGNQLLLARLAGADAPAARQAEWRRGTLPPGELGNRVVTDVMAKVEPLVAAAAGLRQGEPRAIDVAVDLGGRRLTGTVGNVYGDAVVRVEYSRLGAKHRLRAWAQLLALAAVHPETSWTAVTVGRGTRSDVARSALGPVEPAEARRQLAALVDLRAAGLCAPLPMAPKTSATYAAKRASGMTVENANVKAEQEWTGGKFDGERAEAAYQQVWGADAPFDALVAEAVPDGEPSLDGETTRFGVLARRLWEPLLAAETLEQR